LNAADTVLLVEYTVTDIRGKIQVNSMCTDMFCSVT